MKVNALAWSVVEDILLHSIATFWWIYQVFDHLFLYWSNERPSYFLGWFFIALHLVVWYAKHISHILSHMFICKIIRLSVRVCLTCDFWLFAARCPPWWIWMCFSRTSLLLKLFLLPVHNLKPQADMVKLKDYKHQIIKQTKWIWIPWPTLKSCLITHRVLVSCTHWQ